MCNLKNCKFRTTRKKDIEIIVIKFVAFEILRDRNFVLDQSSSGMPFDNDNISDRKIFTFVFNSKKCLHK